MWFRMTDWVITVPKTISWDTWLSELSHARNVGEFMNYRLPRRIRAVKGDRCFVVYDGAIRGWMPVKGVVHMPDGFMCSTTGRVWPEGCYLVRWPSFHHVKDCPPMKGFQGIRRLKEDILRIDKPFEKTRLKQKQESDREKAARKDKKVLTDRDKHWLQGFACAAQIASANRGFELAQLICREGGFDKQDLIEAECEGFDVEAIFGE
jgi:hypothetical protein